MYRDGVLQKDIAVEFMIAESTVSNIISGRRWPRIEEVTRGDF